MNLADAIRRAAQASGAPLGKPEPGASASGSEDRTYTTYRDYPEEEAAATAPQPQQEGLHLAITPPDSRAKEQEVQNLEEHALAHGSNVVRLELVLNPEQLKGFFGAVIASQHSVLTLREAAGYLRTSQRSLERLAGDGEVPGMLVDGKWRFTRQALEDWLTTQPNTSLKRRKEA